MFSLENGHPKGKKGGVVGECFIIVDKSPIL